MRSPSASVRRRAVVALAMAVLPLLPGLPAAAHPFGPPPTALVRAEGSSVVVRWRAAVDDMLAIGERVGVLPEGTVEAQLEGMTQVAPPAAAEAALDASPELRAYLTDRIRVYQDGRRCAATVQPIVDFVGRGATTVHRCPQPVGVAELEITMLHDLHEAYRTFAVDRTDGVRPGQSVHTVARPRVEWDFTDAGQAPPAGAAGPGGRGEAGGMGVFEDRFLALIDTPAPSAWFVVTALVLALGIGAAHALAPGHGKAVAAAYLAGQRARPRDALLLGGAVAAMHTLSVLVLGLALHTLAASGSALERTGPWLTLVAGLLVLAVGTGSLLRVLRHRRGADPGVPAARPHGVGDGVHTHDAALPACVSPLSRRGLVLIGMSGGLLPSPSAFLVLTTALFTGRTLFGLALVAAFSVGLAASLAVVGLAVLRGRDLATRRLAGSPRLVAALDALPLASAVLITIAGVWLTATAATRLA